MCSCTVQLWMLCVLDESIRSSSCLDPMLTAEQSVVAFSLVNAAMCKTTSAETSSTCVAFPPGRAQHRASLSAKAATAINDTALALGILIVSSK